MPCHSPKCLARGASVGSVPRHKTYESRCAEARRAVVVPSTIRRADTSAATLQPRLHSRFKQPGRSGDAWAAAFLTVRLDRTDSSISDRIACRSSVAETIGTFHPRYTAGSGFPHSRQNSSQRDVIKPQDGHILCDPKPAICGFNLIKRPDILKCLNERVTKAGSVRKREQNGRKMGSIDEPSFYQLRRGPSQKVGTPRGRRRDA